MHTRLTIAVGAILALVSLLQSEEIHWDYHAEGPDVWKDLFPTCAGSSQSPIDIRTGCTVYQPMPEFALSPNYDELQTFTITNNGHSLSATLTNDTLKPVTLTGGGLSGTFNFVNFHLHWGENYRSGSEHEVNGEKYAGEIHFVHMNRATGQLAVLGMFMQSAKDTSSAHGRRRKRGEDSALTTAAWKKYFDIAKTLTVTSNKTSIELTLLPLMGKNLNDFWRYNGSLTVPLCTEGVIWSVFTTPITFDDSLIESFREQVFSESYRDPQALNGRTVYRSFANASRSPPDNSSCCLVPKDGTSASIPIDKPIRNGSPSLASFSLLSLAVFLYLSV